MNRVDRLAAMVVGGDELETSVGGQRRPNDLGPSRMLEGLLKSRVLQLPLGMVCPVTQGVDHLHGAILTGVPRN